MNKRNTPKRVLFVAGILILVLVVIFSGLQILESTVFYSGQGQGGNENSKTVIRNGIEYFPRQDLIVILVMGIDEDGPVKDSGSYRNNGEADMVSLVVLDRTAQTYSVLCLNRDMMLDMPALGIDGKPGGSFYGQLALSHTYGTGLEDSAENTRKAVSDVLWGLQIDHYVALNMDAIGLLNDAVGGVTVNVVDDFSAVDPTIPMGTVTLNKEQALNFVRTRKDVGSQMNLSRMERHKEYLTGLTEALTAKVSDSETFAAELYGDLGEYMVTDCTFKVLSSLLQRCAHYEMAEVFSLEGENVLGNEFYEFYADQEKLEMLILERFYAPK